MTGRLDVLAAAASQSKGREGASSGLRDRGENWEGKKSARIADSLLYPPGPTSHLSLLFLSDVLWSHIWSLLKRKKVGRLFAMLGQEKPYEHGDHNFFFDILPIKVSQ